MRRFHPLITGTLLLTAVGFFCRILGFFYRIFLSRTIGAEGLGLYQMIFPIHGIAFALCAGPIQTSLSRLTAASPEKGRAFLRVSLALSLSIALPLTSLIYTFADFLAARVLLAPECAPLLPALALSIPFCAIHACWYMEVQSRFPGGLSRTNPIRIFPVRWNRPLHLLKLPCPVSTPPLCFLRFLP